MLDIYKNMEQPSQQVHVGLIRILNGLQIWVPSRFVHSFHGSPTDVYQCGPLVSCKWVSSRISLGKLQRTPVGPMSLPIWAWTGNNLDVERGLTGQHIRDPFRPHFFYFIGTSLRFKRDPSTLCDGFQVVWSTVSLVAPHVLSIVGCRWDKSGFEVGTRIACF